MTSPTRTRNPSRQTGALAVLAALTTVACAGEAQSRKAPPKKTEAKSSMDNCERTIGPAEAGGLADVVDALPDGAVLCLAAGTYPDAQIVVNKSITLRGLGAPGEVILDGGGRGTIVALNASAKRVTLERLTLTHGAAVQGGGAIAGGAGEELLLREVVLRDNRADGEAPGAALGLTRGKALLEGCRITENRGRGAGGIVYAGGSAQVTLRHTTVEENDGGASILRAHQFGQLHLDHATVARNRGDAAIELMATTVQTPTVTVTDSTLDHLPVAIANGPRLPGKATVTRSLIKGEQRGVTDGGGNR